MWRACGSGTGNHEPPPSRPTRASAAGKGGAQPFHMAAASPGAWAQEHPGHVGMAEECKHAGQGLSSCCALQQCWQQGGPWATAGLLGTTKDTQPARAVVMEKAASEKLPATILARERVDSFRGERANRQVGGTQNPVLTNAKQYA